MSKAHILCYLKLEVEHMKLSHIDTKIKRTYTIFVQLKLSGMLLGVRLLLSGSVNGTENKFVRSKMLKEFLHDFLPLEFKLAVILELKKLGFAFNKTKLRYLNFCVKLLLFSLFITTYRVPQNEGIL